MKKISILILILMITVCSSVQSKDCDVNAGKNQCCSAKYCEGKVLNNKDEHNCKISGGKSWSAGDGKCNTTIIR